MVDAQASIDLSTTRQPHSRNFAVIAVIAVTAHRTSPLNLLSIIFLALSTAPDFSRPSNSGSCTVWVG